MSGLKTSQQPIGLRWRASYWYSTFVVSLGLSTDLLIYSLIIPVLPFQLSRLGYENVSSLMGWLLFAFSGGLVISTIPAALVSEKYNARRLPLIIGLVMLICAQILLMETTVFALMCLARIIQGFASTMVWVVGLALICDQTPERYIGRQLGVCMSGLSIGMIAGPPAAGALYERFGYRGPFIFGMIVAFVDLIARLIVVERKVAIRYGFDPAFINETESEKEKQASDQKSSNAYLTNVNTDKTLRDDAAAEKSELPFLKVIMKLVRYPRAAVASVISLVWGIVYSSQEPVISLHLHAVWGLSPGRVGIVFLAAVIPTLFSSPITGWLSDRCGVEWITVVSLVLSLPWWVVVTLRKELAVFIVAFALEIFCTSGVISPVTAELAAISRNLDGVGYAHVYGAFNLAYGVGSTVGPVIGGQLYDHTFDGWSIISYIAIGLVILCIVLSFIWTGENPLVKRISHRHESPPTTGNEAS